MSPSHRRWSRSNRISLILAAWLGATWIPLRIAFPAALHPPWAAALFDSLTGVLLVIPLGFGWREWRRTGNGSGWLLALGLASLPLVSVTEPTLGNAAIAFYLAKLPLWRGFYEAWTLRRRLDALHPVAARLAAIGTALPLMVHLFACGWVALGSGSPGLNADAVFAYAQAVYWAITTLATVGYGDVLPKTLPQMLYASVVMMIGVGVFGFILGNVATLLFRMDAERERYLTKVDRAEAFMAHHQIPKPLRARVNAYYRYLWESRHGYDERTVLATLPPTLRGEVILALHAALIERVPFFKGAERSSVEAIVLAFKPRVAAPGEILFRAGDPADTLYVIQRGEVDILTANDEPIATLRTGDFFGEMALLTHAPRNATARAADYCDLFLLSREECNRILASHPAFAEHIRTLAATRKAAIPVSPPAYREPPA